MRRYRLIDEEGNDLGRFHASTRVWTPGDVISRGESSRLVVLNLTEADELDDVDGYLVVRVSD